jgi:hypothetical protein
MRKSSGIACSASLTSESGRWSSASVSADRSPVDVCDSARASCQSSMSVAGALQRLALLLAVGVDERVRQDAVQPRLEVGAPR